MAVSARLQRARLRFLAFRDPWRVAIGDPHAQIFVDPRAIRLVQAAILPEDCDGPAPLVAGRFCRKWAPGLVLGGRWHTRVKSYAPPKGLLFQALHARFHGLADWDETAFVRQAAGAVRAGATAWNKCRTMAEIDARCRRADALIQSVKAHGFVVNDEPIRVSIGPGGEIIKGGNGRHRIALGLITEQPIPVQVLVRHRDWEVQRRRAAAGAAVALDHPDLAAIGSARLERPGSGG